MRGVSGSGKSTAAQAIADLHGAQIVSRDNIRLSMFGVESMENEDRVTVAEHAMIDGFLRAGIDVVSDNTNIHWKYVKEIAKIGYKHGAEVELYAIDVPLAECKKRNDKRAMLGGRHVPHEVIERQHSRFQGTKDNVLDPVVTPKKYEGTPGKPDAFLVDIDGTLAHMNGRGPFDWKRVSEDLADEVIVDIVNDLAIGSYERDSSYEVIVMSGRDESCRAETIKWLHKAGVSLDYLFMRPEKDMRPDNIVKAELFDEHVRDNFNVRFVIDDRDQVVRMWKRMGLKVLNVAGLDDGNF